jgi:seryl-tRNA synthetase
MIPLKWLRETPEKVAALLASRGYVLDVEAFQKEESQKKSIQQKLQALQEQRNAQSKCIGEMKAKGVSAEEAIAAMHAVNEQLKEVEATFQRLEAQQKEWMLMIPNVPDEAAPEGRSEHDNVEVGRWGEVPIFDFEVKDHLTLATEMGGAHFEEAGLISGARFCYLTGKLAKLHRVLAQFMLDQHTEHHGYEEVNVPVMVQSHAMTASGQFPKFREEAYQIESDGLCLIPTSEVPLVNWVNDKICDAHALPIKFTSHSLCFRREAGSYGKDTKGLIRMHQFEKIELVQLVAPENAHEALEEMRAHAERILQLLRLPYRVMNLCRGDLGFCAAQTYDLEVWMSGQNCYREISSISNCADFQARRLNARVRGQDGKPRLMHTLNGSGVAVGRCLVAILENYQQANGCIRLPEVLVPYFGRDIL